ncbi:hypothetical protein WA026_005750 [Henosepilachna vigintioctopunctata]|uniref:Reverse transcriptase domain-containing protein n=1 Tax=Henosepilachna vigintioctopunctata TaxID=420089 RepID=A0AAW1U1U9_9CUCU
MSVKVQECWSTEEVTDLGVPQGSVLGPLLFMLFINDLPGQVGADSITLFADDTSIAVTARDPEELLGKCALLMNEFSAWCQSNALMLNISKTECLYFSHSTLDRKLIIPFKNDEVESNAYVKFLGVFLDHDMKWSVHIAALNKKLNSAFYAINRIKDCLHLNYVMEVYYALVYSHITYNILLWGNSADSRRIFISQKRILRMIFKLKPRDSCRLLFIEKEILTTPCIYIYKCLMHVKLHEKRFTKLNSFHCYNTRHTELLFIPKHGTARFEESPAYQCIKLYNHLPLGLKSLGLVRFRRVLKSVLLNKGYYSVGEYLADKFT